MNATGTTARPAGRLWPTLLGPLIWAAHLFAMYGLETLLCAGIVSDADHFRPTAVALTAAAVAALLGIMAAHVRTVSEGQHSFVRFRREISLALAGLALIGVLWGALSAVLLPACTPA